MRSNKKKIGWRDTTSYSQSEITRDTRTVEVAFGSATLIVTRVHRLKGWYMSFYVNGCKHDDLAATGLEDAKIEALVRIRTQMKAILSAMEKM